MILSIISSVATCTSREKESKYKISNEAQLPHIPFTCPIELEENYVHERDLIWFPCENVTDSNKAHEFMIVNHELAYTASTKDSIIQWFQTRGQVTNPSTGVVIDLEDPTQAPLLITTASNWKEPRPLTIEDIIGDMTFAATNTTDDDEQIAPSMSFETILGGWLLASNINSTSRSGNLRV